MNSTASLVCLLVGLAVVVVAAIVARNRTVLLGLTLALMFQVGSAGLSAFIYGRLLGLDEGWVNPDRIQVFRYCSLGVLAMAFGVALGWWSLKDFGKRLRPYSYGRSEAHALPWANRDFVFFCLGLGVAAMLLRPLVSEIPTLNTAVRLSTNWMKIGVIVSILAWKLRKDRVALLSAIGVYIPFAVFNTLASGFSPLASDLAIPVVLVVAFLSGITWRSFVVTALASIVLLHLMVGWMSSRTLIRSGALDSFPLAQRAEIFLTSFWSNATAFDRDPAVVQQLLMERIDMSDILEMQVLFQPSVEPFQYGRTILGGLYSFVPRFLWPAKPVVAGYAEFVSQFTGMVRAEDDQTSIGVPVEFELYANGGPIAVAGGLFLLGLLAATMERRLTNPQLTLRQLLPLIFALISISNGIQQITLVAAAIGCPARFKERPGQFAAR